MRILIVARVVFSPGQTSGVRAQIEATIPALAARGHAVRAIVLNPDLPPGRLAPVPETPELPLLAAQDPGAAFRALAEKERPDAVFILGSGVVEIAHHALSRSLPTALLVSDAQLEWPLASLAGARGVALLAVTPFIARRLAAALGLDAQVAATAIEPESYRVESVRRTALFVNPVPMKGVHRVLAMARARPQIPFVFAETWPAPAIMRDKLRARAKTLPNVTWMPTQRDPRVLYREARLLLVPSVWEEAGARVVTEAQLSGIPAIASARGGLPEMVGPGGLVVDLDAPLADWLTAFDAVWSDEAAYRHYADAARAHAEATVTTPAAAAARLEAWLIGVGAPAAASIS